MTRNMLEDYPHICAKIAEYEAREARTVSDTVSGSSEDYPFTKHPVSIKGIARLTPIEEAKLARLREKRRAIEDWVETLPDGKERLVRSVMKHGTKWNVVRREMDNGKSANATRMEYERIFEKY